MCGCHRSLLDYCGNSLRHFIFMHLFHKTHTRNQHRSILSPHPPPPHISAKPQQKQSATRIRRRCGCLMTDSAGLSIITLIIIIISIAAGSHEHLHSPNIPGGALSLPLAQSCGVRVCRWWLRCRQHLLGGFCAGDITVQVVIPAVQMRRDGRGAAPPPLPLRSPARADLGSESRIETGSL